MTMRMSPGFSRILALLILVCAVTAVLLFVVAPVAAAFRGYGERTATALSLLERYRTALADGADLEARIHELRSRSDGDAYIAAPSEALAAAELQKRLKDVSEQVGADLKSTQALEAQTEGGFRKVGIRVVIRAPVNTLSRILHILEAGTPFLFIENLDVRDGGGDGGAGRGQGTAGLHVNFDVHGFMRVAGT